MLGTYAAAAAMTYSWPPTTSRTPVVNMFGQFPCVAQRLLSIYKLREGVQYYNKIVLSKSKGNRLDAYEVRVYEQFLSGSLHGAIDNSN